MVFCVYGKEKNEILTDILDIKGLLCHPAAATAQIH